MSETPTSALDAILNALYSILMPPFLQHHPRDPDASFGIFAIDNIERSEIHAAEVVLQASAVKDRHALDAVLVGAEFLRLARRYAHGHSAARSDLADRELFRNRRVGGAWHASGPRRPQVKPKYGASVAQNRLYSPPVTNSDPLQLTATREHWGAPDAPKTWHCFGYVCRRCGYSRLCAAPGNFHGASRLGADRRHGAQRRRG